MFIGQYRLLMNRLVALTLALYLLNFSIDSRDALPDHLGEDLSYNDIESEMEFLAEVVFGSSNVFEEHDEKDNYDGSVDLDKYFCAKKFNGDLIIPIIASTEAFNAAGQINVMSPSINIISPPPKG
jgi:hypothetical protein